MLLLPVNLTVYEARATLLLLVRALKREPNGRVTVDASQLKQFDSAALAVILECRRQALALRRSFAVHGMPPKLLTLATLYGVSSLLIESGDTKEPALPLL